MTVAQSRRVRRDGIRFCGYRYFDVSLSGYIGEDITIRYDPRDLAQIHVYSNDSSSHARRHFVPPFHQRYSKISGITFGAC
ncbi:MAG: Mu transposase C-terminal domain-containing protein [Candidatus Obscuribacterales bacterium]|nr:Mu transposase C-terminal domain-containing protein [Candidatus Obscuribacterales bacterium]